MRWLTLFIGVLLLCSVVFAVPQDFSSLVIDGSLANSVDISPQPGDPTVSSLTANISWFPFTRAGQKVEFFTTVPKAELTTEEVVFSLRKPDLGHHTFDIEYRVETSVDAVRVKKRIPFPLKTLSSDFLEFVSPTETIDSNVAIRSLAAELASGEDDLFKLVTKVGQWTKDNVAYDLSTSNVEASQPASYVLENRVGVCDELTNLFIALLRSLGVPARFVSGIAYTSSDLFDEPWGAHGWAEVYFPGVGWVPFDVTYGQFGYVDASHIVFATGVDSGKYTSSYSWLAHDVAVSVNPMTILASVVEEGAPIDPLLSYSITPLESAVGFGSYQVVLVEIENPTSFYVADTVQLSLVNGFTLLDTAEQVVVLAPYESTKVYWRLLVDKNLDRHYLYTFPLVVRSHRGGTAQSEFVVRSNERALSESWVDRFTETVNTDESPYLDKMVFSCSPLTKGSFRVNETVSISCSLKNTGELDVKDISICSGDDCELVSVPAGAARSVILEKSFIAPSLYALPIVASHDFFEVSSYVSVDVVEPISLAITDLTAPSSIDYDSAALVSFIVDHTAGLPARDVTVTLQGPVVSTDWQFDELAISKEFEVSLAGNALSLSDDSFAIIVSYTDDKDERVMVKENFTIALGEISWWQRIVLWINGLLA